MVGPRGSNQTGCPRTGSGHFAQKQGSEGGHQEVPVTAGSLVQLESHNPGPKASPQPLPGPRHPGQEGKGPRSGPSSREYLEQTALLPQLTLPVLGCPTRRGPWSARCVHTARTPLDCPAPSSPLWMPARESLPALSAATLSPACTRPSRPNAGPEAGYAWECSAPVPLGPYPRCTCLRLRSWAIPRPSTLPCREGRGSSAAGGVIPPRRSLASSWGARGGGEEVHTERDGQLTRAWTRQARHPQPPGEGEMPPSGSILRPRA